MARHTANTVVAVTPPQLAGTRVRARQKGSAWEVRAERLQDLRALAAMSVDAARISEVDVTVARWNAPAEGWIGSPRVPGLTALAIEQQGSGVRVHLAVAAATDAAVLLAACVRCLMPAARDAGAQLTFAPGLSSAAGVVADRLFDVLAAGETRDAHVRRADVLLVPEAAADDVPERATTVRIGAETWSRDGQAFEVCVDPSVHRPLGRRSVGTNAIASASVTGGVVTLETPDDRLVLGRSVAASSTRALRGIGAVVSTELPVTVVRQLHACGVLVVDSSDDLPAPDDDLAWQVRSVHERRHALRAFGPAAALDGWPSVSAVLVTHRGDFLEHAVRQLDRLDYPRLQVVIGMHGDAVDPQRVRDLVQGIRHEVVVVTVDGEATLGAALQMCCARAEGDLVTKIDDDDLYGPEHVWDLVLARQYSGAEVVGKALDWIHVESSDVTVFRPTYPAEKYADFVAGGTILISRADLAEVGGWRPVPKSVDRALLDRVLAAGGLVYRTHGLGYVYVRRPSGHTASVRDEHFLTKVTTTHAGLIRHEVFGTRA